MYRRRLLSSALLATGFLLSSLPRPLHAHTALLYVYDDWRYDASGTDFGAAWQAVAFDDSAWSVGESPLGGGNALPINHKTPLPVSLPTIYFRHDITLDVPPGSITSLTLNTAYGQGIVAYLNGQEILRRSMPAVPIDYNTPAMQHLPMAIEAIDLSAASGLLVSGKNVFAVEVHQTSPPTDFVYWDGELLFTTSVEHVVRGPYLQMATPTSVHVRWRTSVPTASRVTFGTTQGSLDQHAGSASPTTEHEVTLSGLAPSTRYFYGVGSDAGVLEGGDASHAFTTPPPAGAAKKMRLWVLGDSGTADDRARAVRDGFLGFDAGAPLDFVMMLGDNAYDNGTDADYQYGVFERKYEKTLRASPLWPTNGNHDWQNGTETAYYDIFSLPMNGEAGGTASGTEDYYAFDWGNVHFVSLQSNFMDQVANPADADAMLAWLQGDLAATTQPWVVALFHHPPYTHGEHDSDTDGVLDGVRNRMLPVLEAGGADLVLAGHSHDYERSILIDGQYGLSSDFANAPAMYTVQGGDGREGGDGPYHKPAQRGPHQGTVYVVDGNSGARGDGATSPLDHPVMVELLDPFSGRTARGLDVAGSMLLTVDDQRLDASYVAYDGQVVDTFTILKGKGMVSGTGGSGGAGGSSATGAGGGAGASGEGGASGAGGGGAGGGDTGGCGCRAPASRERSGAAALAVVVALAAAARRRRRV